MYFAFLKVCTEATKKFNLNLQKINWPDYIAFLSSSKDLS